MTFVSETDREERNLEREARLRMISAGCIVESKKRRKKENTSSNLYEKSMILRDNLRGHISGTGQEIRKISH
jgi:hypothetical protein